LAILTAPRSRSDRHHAAAPTGIGYLAARSPGKFRITLDLRKVGAFEVFGDLVRRADVVIENFTAGTAERLRVGYDAVRHTDERIVYCSNQWVREGLGYRGAGNGHRHPGQRRRV
jgi:crotonobetainyl-CoA:carnitine CoA-transferase CaiB-like acyl-CoA transferase